MPCHNASHTHKWPRSGALSIAKCESRCNFCTSEKDYKPASALRKHVLTHIKNDEMPLTLEKSTGGRSRLQTTTNVPMGNNQPELPPSHSEEPEFIAATNLANEQADVEGRITRYNDDLFQLLKDTFATREVRYSEQVALILHLESVVDAVHFLKSAGSRQRLFQEALDNLKIHMMEIDSKDWSTWLEEPRYGDRWFWFQIEQSFLIYLQARQENCLSQSSAIFHEIFYGMVIFTVTTGILNDSGSPPRGPVPEATDGNSSTTESAFRSQRPILLVIEEPRQRWYEYFDELFGINLLDDLRELDAGDLPPNWDFLVVANIVPTSDTVIKLAEDDERVNKLIKGFLLKWVVADSIP